MDQQKIDYIVLGAGIAGLGAAYELQMQGKNVLVLEKEAFVGGRMSTITIDGISIDIGAKFLVPPVYKNISRFAAKCNIPFHPISASKFAVMKNGIPLVCDGKDIVSVFQFQVLSLKAKIKLGLLIGFLLAKYRKLDMYHLDEALPLDTESVYTYFKRYLPQECFDYLLDPLFIALFSYSSKEFSKAFFLSLLRKMIKVSFYSFDGGINALCMALARKVPTQCNMEVLSIQRQKNATKIIVNDLKKKKVITYHAKKVIIALPGNVVLPLLKNPIAAEKTFFSQVHYSQATSIHFTGITSSFKNFSTLWFPEKENKYISSLVKDFYGTRRKNHDVFALGLRPQFVIELKRKNQLTKEYLIHFIEQELPIQNVNIFYMNEWKGMCPKVEPGYLKKRYDFFKKTINEKQIFYCGDYLENPSTEGALTSGIKTAKRIIGLQD